MVLGGGSRVHAQAYSISGVSQSVGKVGGVGVSEGWGWVQEGVCVCVPACKCVKQKHVHRNLAALVCLLEIRKTNFSWAVAS